MYLFCKYFFSACMSAQPEAQESFGFLETAAVYDNELPCVHWTSNSRLLHEQQILSTAETSLQSSFSLRFERFPCLTSSFTKM